MTSYFEIQICDYIAYFFLISGFCTFLTLALEFQQAGYGRYANKARFRISPKLAWFIQECPAFFIPFYRFFFEEEGSSKGSVINCILIGMFLLHYFQRSFVYPLLVKGNSTPFYIMAMAFCFCSFNGYLQATSLKFSEYPSDYYLDARFIIGVSLFICGMVINLHSDHLLRNLRKPGETGYKIPRGGLFEYVSGANYFGEIIEWSGYAIACWNLHTFAFAFFTFCNIGPRGSNHHNWYKEKFRESYPKKRKAVIPFIW